MMFKIMIFLFLFSNIFAEKILIEGTKREEIFFKEYLINGLGIPNEKIVLNSFNQDLVKKNQIGKVIKILSEDVGLNEDYYIEMEIKGEKIFINKITSREVKLKNENVLVNLVSQNKKTPYIWEDKNKNLYINNLEFLKDEELKKKLSIFFLEYLENEIGIKKEENKENEKSRDISIIANNIIKILVSGVILMFALLIFSKKKKFGDSFKGE